MSELRRTETNSDVTPSQQEVSQQEIRQTEFTQQITIINKLGLHARAAAKVAALATQYEAKQLLIGQDQTADCKSIMSLLMLAAGRGTDLTLKTSGPDAEAACQAMHALIANRFEELE
jgi:phosphotransferase system HPr (HPr) family protein